MTHSYCEVSSVSRIEKSQADRRQSDRFPIACEVRYRVLNKRSGEEVGEGNTVNISSSGVLFTSKHLLLPGRRMELAISWPVQLNNQVALKLVARGRVVRFDEGRAAIEIQQYEFHTQSAGASAGGPRLAVN
jgi:c-di-GMP-binding flagellar brake protein YcgR